MLKQHASVQSTPPTLLPGDIQTILTLRLLIARVANPDSLGWWDDEALTPSADFVLKRLFPMAPGLAGRSLALQAALTRHNAVCPANALHLYHLDSDNYDTLALRGARLGSVPLVTAPVTTLQGLREVLEKVTEGPYSYTVRNKALNGCLLIECLRPPANIHPFVHRSKMLAWAYLEGKPNAPVFPYCLEVNP